jgi:predicted metal-dependent enzyme (double-stranded beta helix superfamily)
MVTPYRRAILHRGHRCEVLLATWAEGARCAPHDHGPARGFVLLLRGQFVERTWARRGSDLVVTSTRTLRAPARLPVDQGHIHDMLASAGGLSLHVYLPSIRRMRVFDVTRRETLVVSDDCGAWIPAETGQIVSREAWA